MFQGISLSLVVVRVNFSFPIAQLSALWCVCVFPETLGIGYCWRQDISLTGTLVCPKMTIAMFLWLLRDTCYWQSYRGQDIKPALTVACFLYSVPFLCDTMKTLSSELFQEQSSIVMKIKLYSAHSRRAKMWPFIITSFPSNFYIAFGRNVVI